MECFISQKYQEMYNTYYYVFDDVLYHMNMNLLTEYVCRDVS